jgi:1,2-diacylglycerol 3-alpha-glucosyltransferase
VHVVPTGIDVDGIRALEPIDPRPEAGWPSDAIVIATLGRLAPEKSVEVILDAATTAFGREPRARLLVIGGGPSEAELRRRATDRVHLTGALPRLDALARLRAANLFAFASRTETQGLVLAEALAAGLPAVAVEGPGVADSVRDGVDGRIVPADPAATRAQRLGESLATLIEDSAQRARLAERARDDAGRFALANRVAEIEGIYRAAMAR